LCSPSILRSPPGATLFPYTTLFRSPNHETPFSTGRGRRPVARMSPSLTSSRLARVFSWRSPPALRKKSASKASSLKRERQRASRSEEHTSELQSRENLVCRLLLEKK